MKKAGIVVEQSIMAAKIYKKTSDDNIIKEEETIEGYIYLDKLQEQIDILRVQIAAFPDQKTEPDQETLDLWNSEIPVGLKQELEEELEAKELLLIHLKSLQAKQKV